VFSEIDSGSSMIDSSSNIFDDIRLYLPKYLSAERQEDLRAELRQFPNNRSIYSNRNVEDEMLQGDGWRGFIAIDFHSRQDKVLSGLVVSNSCDTDRRNTRPISTNILFAPLVREEAYGAALIDAGKSQEQRDDILTSIRLQQVTFLMHLPGITGEFEPSIARFDDLRGHPLDAFFGGGTSRVFRLSDFGLYLLLFKLSLHFTRMQEGVAR